MLIQCHAPVLGARAMVVKERDQFSSARRTVTWNMELLKPPEGLSPFGNVTENRTCFLQRFGFFTEGTSSTTVVRVDKQKVVLLLHVHAL